MKRIFLSWLFAIIQVVTPAYAGTQTIVKADIVDGVSTYKNYAGQYSHFEKNVNGWVRYDDTTATPTSCGTLSGQDNTFTRSTSTPLAGDASGLWTKAAANRVGEGIALPFTIDGADKGAVLKINFDYEVSTNYADNDIRVWVYDVTNSRMIEPAPNYVKKSLVQSSIQSLEFQTSIDSTSYKLCIHQASTSALDYTFKLDGVKISKSAVSSGPFISDWQSYTPTFEGSTTDPTIGTGGSAGITGRWRRVGDTMHVEAHARFGTSGTSPGSGTLYLTIPSEHTIDSAKLSTNMNNFNYGHCTVYDSANAANHRVGTIQLGSGGYKWVGCYMNATGNYSSGFAGFSPNANDDEFTIQAIVPIVGWGSNQKQSSDAETRAVAAIYEISGSSSNTSFADITAEIVDFDVKRVDTHNAVTTGAAWKFTAPVGGVYRVSASMSWANATNLTQTIFYLFKQGSQSSILDLFSGTDNMLLKGSTSIDLKAGEYIDIRAYQDDSTNAARSIFTSVLRYKVAVELVQGPEQIAASETVAVRASSNAGTQTLEAAGSGETMIFEDEHTDTHGAYNTSTGIFTAPIAGHYSIDFGVSTQDAAWTVGNVLLGEIRVSGTTTQRSKFELEGTNTIEANIYGSFTVYLTAGQTIDIFIEHNRSGGDLLPRATTAENYLSITRIGL